MNILPILIGVFLYLKKNANSPLVNFLSNVDVKEVISILKDFGIENEILSSFNQEIFDIFKNGELDFKKLLPYAIKFFSKKKETKTKTFVSVNPLDNIACSEIKNSMYNYLNC